MPAQSAHFRYGRGSHKGSLRSRRGNFLRAVRVYMRQDSTFQRRRSTASKIHKRWSSRNAVGISSCLAVPSILLASRIDAVCPRRTTRNIVLKNILGLSVRPYCFSLRCPGIRLFYYTIFVADLGNFRPLFPLTPPSFYLQPLRYPVSYIIFLLHSKAAVRELGSYPFNANLDKQAQYFVDHFVDVFFINYQDVFSCGNFDAMRFELLRVLNEHPSEEALVSVGFGGCLNFLRSKCFE